jgi:hypothetical protein
MKRVIGIDSEFHPLLQTEREIQLEERTAVRRPTLSDADIS